MSESTKFKLREQICYILWHPIRDVTIELGNKIKRYHNYHDALLLKYTYIAFDIENYVRTTLKNLSINEHDK